MQAAGVVLLACVAGAIGWKKPPSDRSDPDPDLSVAVGVLRERQAGSSESDE